MFPDKMIDSDIKVNINVRTLSREFLKPMSLNCKHLTEHLQLIGCY